VKGNKLGLFVSYYKPHWKLFALDMVCALGIAAVDLLFPLLSRYCLYNLLPDKAYGVFFLLMGGLVAAYVLRAVFSYVVTYWGHSLGVRMEADMRRDLFAHMQTLSFTFYDKNRTGQLMSRLTTDLFDITELAHHGPEDLFISAVTLVGACGVMLTIDRRLALTLAGLVPILLLFVVSRRRRMRVASRRVKERVSDINAGLESGISGARVAKAFANEGYEAVKFNRGNEGFKRAKNEFYSAMALFHGGMEFFTSLFNVAVICVGGALIMSGGMNHADLLVFMMYVTVFLQPVRRLSQFVEQFAGGMAGFRRFAELLDEAPDIVDTPGARPVSSVRGEIVFEDVSFSYDGKARVLEHICLVLPAGSTLALVGPSGGGKTTLCHLIPRFYEVKGGRITLDGRDIRDITLASLRSHIGIVSQDIFLFADTVMENIRYGRLDATDAEVYEAARRAEIHDAILEMENGYQTQVGERGARLSGGQKQRLSIARIFLKNPPVLILDEATSALDTITETKIQRALEELSRGRTTLVIAHRLSTVRDADEIAVIDEEGIRERGRHEQLLTQGGLYAALYSGQLANGG
jgi:ATP-binding cassette subfamily B protein